MFCNNCGSKLDEDSQFCVNCGKPVKAASEVLPKQPASFFAPAVDLADTTLRPRPPVSAAPAANFAPVAPAAPTNSAPVVAYARPAASAPNYAPVASAAPAESAPVSAYARPAAPAPNYAPVASAAPAESAPVVAYARPAAPTPNFAPVTPVAPAESAPVSAYARPVASHVNPPAASPKAIPVKAYPSEAPTVAEPAAVEAPSVIRRPPVMAPPPKKKKAGLVWIWVIIALLVAALVGVTIWGFVDGWLPELFSGESTSSSRDKDDEEDNDGPAHPDWEKYDLDGLTIYLPDDFELEDDFADGLYFESREYEITAKKYDLDDIFDDRIETAEAFRSAWFPGVDADGETELKEGTANGVPYVLFIVDEEEYYVYAFYVDGEDGWNLRICGEDVDDTKDMIEYVTSSVIRDSSEETPRDDEDDVSADNEMWD